MTIQTVSNLNDLDTTAVATAADLLTSMVQDQYPNLDITPGSVLHTLVVRLHASLQALAQTNIDIMQQSLSLLSLVENPSLADPDVVDALLSNYGVTRQTGAVASGTLLLIFNSLRTISVPQSITFTANGVNFVPTQSFTGVVSSDEVFATGDRVLQDVGNGQYALQIDVVATTAGVAGNVTKGTVFSTDSTVLNPKSTTAYADFDGGSDTETNEELVIRLQDGISTPGFGSRLSVGSAIRKAFPVVSDVSVIGSGDPEMRRGQHNTLGLASAGFVDVYTRTRSYPLVTTVALTGTKLTEANQWNLNITRGEVPGFYRVLAVRVAGAVATDTLEILSDVRGVDTSLPDGLDVNPAVTVDEAIFTRFSTATITFKDPTKPTAVTGETALYDVDILYMPEIADISDYFMSRANRPPAGDYLIKAPIPCMVATSIQIVPGPGESGIDTGAIKNAVSSSINALTFNHGRVTVGQIIAAVYPLLPKKSRIKLPIELRGSLLIPGGETVTISTLFAEYANNFELVPPDAPENMTTQRTVTFFCSPADVSVTVLPVDYSGA